MIDRRAPRRRRARPPRAGPAPRARDPCCGRWRDRRVSAWRRDRAPTARFMLAQHGQAAGVVDLGGDFLGQELRGALQRLARLGEAAELQPRLAEQMQRLSGIGPQPRRPAPATARRRRSRRPAHAAWRRAPAPGAGGRRGPRAASSRGGVARAKKKPAVDREAEESTAGQCPERDGARQGKIRPGSGFGDLVAPEGLVGLEPGAALAQAEIAQGAMVELWRAPGVRGRAGARSGKIWLNAV